MRFLPVVVAVFASTQLMVPSLAAAFATLNNETNPNTQIEVGDTVDVTITGGSSSATVTIVQNGGSPVVMGSTDSSGYFRVVATEGSGDVGSYTQVWYVGGVAASAGANAYGPSLPSFNVFANFVGTNCPGQSTTNSTRHWIWSPVTYGSTSTPIVTAASQWNYWVSGTISLSNDTSAYEDVAFSTGSLPSGVLALTGTYGQDSNDSCVDTLDACGDCLTPAVMYYATVETDSTQITTLASSFGTTVSALTDSVVAHEFGHVLKLGDVQPTNGTCSEIQSIMYAVEEGKYFCNVLAPTSSCDVNGINQVYPSAVNPFCEVPDPYCGHGSCS